jgi:hypothetical protein
MANSRCDAKFTGLLFVSKYLIKRYGEYEAIKRTISKKNAKYFKFK